MFRKELVKALAHATGKESTNEIAEIDRILEVPPEELMGDFSFPCFSFSKEQKKAPQKIAEELAGKVSLPSSFERIEIKGAYINFFLKKSALAEQVLTIIAQKKEEYGKGQEKNERIMVEYCQVNTHKAFHVGHLRGTILGQSLVNLLRYAGYPVVAANYQGDIGTHVAKCLWYLQKFNKEPMPNTNKGEWLGRIYQKANLKLKEHEKLKNIVNNELNNDLNDEFKDEVQSILKSLEEGDATLTKIWQETRKYSLDDFEIIYKRLGVKFDEYFFESEMELPGKELVNILLEKNIAIKSEGAIIVDYEKEGLGVFIILKKNGTALYSTKDLALAKIKFEKFKIDRAIYSVGAEQTLYFQQLFKTLELMGFPQAKHCFHLPYGLVTLQGGKISSREGELLTAIDLFDLLTEEATKEVKERHKEWTIDKIEQTANSIAMAGIKFAMIVQDPNRPINFDVKKAVEFEGETGPYVQYTHARICSILRKVEKTANINEYTEGEKNISFNELTNPLEKTILIELMGFSNMISSAGEQYRPALVARYLLVLCQKMNEYYHAVQILSAEEKTRNARLLLIYCVKEVIASGLNILGIVALEEM